MLVRPRPGLLLLVGLTLGARALAQEPPAPPPVAPRRGLKIGVVDHALLFRDSKRRLELERALEAERAALRADLAGAAFALERLRIQFDRSALLPGTDAWLALRDELGLATLLHAQERGRLERALEERADLLTDQLVRVLRRAVRSYGRQHGYDLILRADPGSAEGLEGELGARFRARCSGSGGSTLLFQSEAVDITAAVTRHLNALDRPGRIFPRPLAPPAPHWPHLSALAPPHGWELEARPDAPDRRRWRAEVVVRAIGDADGVTELRVVDDQASAVMLGLPALPPAGPFAWAVRAGERVRLDVFRRRSGLRQGTAVAIRALPSGRLLLFYDDGLCPPCGVEDMDDITATLTPLLDQDPGTGPWAATTLRLVRGNDTVTLADDAQPLPLGRSGLVARVIQARIHTGNADEPVGAWLVWRPAE